MNVRPRSGQELTVDHVAAGHTSPGPHETDLLPGASRRYLDPAQADFLVARLGEKIAAATTRPCPQRGVFMMIELRTAIESRQELDWTSIDILMLAFARHPGFRTQWSHRVPVPRSAGVDDVLRTCADRGHNS